MFETFSVLMFYFEAFTVSLDRELKCDIRNYGIWKEHDGKCLLAKNQHLIAIWK